MKRIVSVAAVFVLLTTLVWVGSAWTGDLMEPPKEKCCPCFYVNWTGPKTTFGNRVCFKEENNQEVTATTDGGQPKQRLRCGTFCTEPVCFEVTVTRFITETRTKTVRIGRKVIQVPYTVKVPIQETIQVCIPRLEGKWCGVDPCKYTTWSICHENEIKVIGGGTTVGNRFYGKVYITGLPGCVGTYKLYGERNCNTADGGDGIDCLDGIDENCDRTCGPL